MLFLLCVCVFVIASVDVPCKSTTVMYVEHVLEDNATSYELTIKKQDGKL